MEPEQPRRPVQFGLSKLIQMTAVAALWSSAGITRDDVTRAMAYTVVTAIATWVVVGRWTLKQSPRTGRRVLAVTTALMVAGGASVTVLVEDSDYLPIVWMATVLVTALPAGLFVTPTPSALPIVVLVASVLLMILLISLFWNFVYWCWDRMSMRASPAALIWSFSFLLGLMCLPLLLSISGGCYTFAGHGKRAGEVQHVWLHCVLHVGMFVAAGVNIALLQWRGRCAAGPPGSWLKLMTLGYLCLYAVLCQVALFPINFYIP